MNLDARVLDVLLTHGPQTKDEIISKVIHDSCTETWWDMDYPFTGAVERAMSRLRRAGQILCVDRKKWGIAS